nr:MBL fold metallo-hydrolase [bacterium]
EEGDEKTVVFSGDIGRFGKVLLRDPTLIPRADAVVVESTYGDRNHETPNDAVDKFVEIVVSTRAKGGNIVIPSFAIERAQEILYAMDVLLGNDRIPHLITFLDSPMAIKVTEIYDRYPHYLNPAALRRAPGALFDFPLLTLTRTAAESKAINHIKGSAIIIAGSGMCTGGRIKHHLQHNISRAESTILFVGYQAVGTLGRYILGRPESVRIFGASHPVQARIEQISGFSAHAGRDDLLRWMDGFGNTPRRVFVVHSERESSQAFASALRERMKAEVAAPEYGETFEF